MTKIGFRLRASGLHLCGSATVLTLVLGGLYAGWYRWPGWYLTGAAHMAGIMAGVDVALGPLLTLLIADSAKSRRELARDIGVIVLVQLAALAYGATSLWQGRPVYYTFSEDRLEVVQASELDAAESALALRENPAFAPHWYRATRWVWAPLPPDPQERAAIIRAALTGGKDVIERPRYFKPWSAGLPELRRRLKPVDRLVLYSRGQKQVLRQQMQALGLDPAQASTLFMIGRGDPLLVVFDPDSLAIRAMLRAD